MDHDLIDTKHRIVVEGKDSEINRLKTEIYRALASLDRLEDTPDLGYAWDAWSILTKAILT